MLSRNYLIESRHTLRLALPLIGAQLAQMSMYFTDVAMIGRLNELSLASMSVGHSSFSFFFAFGIGICAAMNPLVAQDFGADRRGELALTVRRGLWAAVLTGVIGIALLSQISQLYLALEHPPQVVLLASAYVGTLAWGLIPAFVFNVYKNALDGVSRPQLAFRIALLGTALNLVLNWLFIYGSLGFPALGVRGAALATVLVNIFNAALVVWAAGRTPEFAAVRLGWFPGWRELAPVFALGVPMGVSIGAECGFFVMGALMMGKLGVAESAAHQVALTCAATAFMVPLGLSLAASVRVGQLTGAGKHEQARTAGWTAMGLALVFMCVTATLFLTSPRFFIGLFLRAETADPKAMELARQLLIMAGFFQLFDGLQIAANGALRGLKDVKVPMAMSLTAFWGAGFATSYGLAFHTPLRHLGIWTGFLVGLGLTAAALTVRFWLLTRQAREQPCR